METSIEFCEEKQELRRIDGVVIGVLAMLDDSGAIFVDYPSNPSGTPLQVRSTVLVKKEDIGRKIAVMFEDGNPEKPIIMGLIQLPESKTNALFNQVLSQKEKRIDVQIDGERLTLTAKNEIVLRCGKASITLTKAGKVVIRGTYLSSQSSGPNLIKGGSVQLN